MKKIFIFILLNLSIFLFASDKFNLKSVNDKVIKIESVKKGFDFKDYKNKVVLLDFFGSVCPPCLNEIPHLINLQNRYKKDFQIIALQVQIPMTKEVLQQFKKQHNINYPVINLEESQDLVRFTQFNTNWGGQIPFMMLFDKNGTLQKMYLGPRSEEELASDIESFIK